MRESAESSHIFCVAVLKKFFKSLGLRAVHIDMNSDSETTGPLSAHQMILWSLLEVRFEQTDEYDV